MDRSKYTSIFTLDSLPNWFCPSCKKGYLKIADEMFVFDETKESRMNRNMQDWHPDETVYLYSCIFRCNNSDCRQIVTSTGRGGTFIEKSCDKNKKPIVKLVDYFEPRFFIPSLILFDIPENTPQSVKFEILFSFGSFFFDSNSAANHARIALEILLDDLKIRKTEGSLHKRYRLNLHKRIDLLPQKYDKVKPLFLAIKWLGNAGCHSGNRLTNNDVLDLYELMSDLLNTVYDTSSKRIQKLANKINKKKCPI